MPPRHDHDWLALQDHALAVPCPTCCAAINVPCRRNTNAPACIARITLARTQHPDTQPPPPEPERERFTAPHRLRAAAALRRELHAHRTPCERCRLPVIWATGPKGRIAIDATPTQAPANPHHPEPPLCTLQLDQDGPRAVPLTPGQVVGARTAGHSLHQPHRSTCRKP